MNDLQEIQETVQIARNRIELILMDLDKMRVDLAHELSYVGTKLCQIDREIAEMRDHYGY